MKIFTTTCAPGYPLSGGIGMSSARRRGFGVTAELSRRHEGDVPWGAKNPPVRGVDVVVKPIDARQAPVPLSLRRASHLT